MGEAVGQIVSFGVTVALSPVPIIAVVLMLATPRGGVNGPAFLGGWIVGIAVLGTIVLLITDATSGSRHDAHATWLSILTIALDLFLLLIIAREWRRRRGERDAQLPTWMRTIDQFTAARSGSTGVVISVVNPKNLPLVVGAALAIAQTGAKALSQAVALTVFTAIAAVGVGAPVAMYLVMGERANTLLGGLHRWVARRNAAIMAVLCLLIAVKLIVDTINAVS
jgi:threonine/homoserine/homoserine lactone efflux protein